RESDHRAWTPVTYTVTRQNATIQGLIQGKAYFFRIAAENIIGMGPFTETTKEILIRDPITVPDRPEDLEVKAVTKNSVTLTWNPPKYNGGSDITMYVLESRLIGKDKFHKVTKEKMLDRKFTVEGLKEGDTYEYRVSACNIVGQGKPSFCTKPITCKDEIAPPTLDLDFRDKLIVRVGEAFSLTGRYSGKPAPKVTWLKDDIVLKEDDRIKIKTTPTTLCLGILKSVREDTGKYCVTVENSTGSRKGFCQVNVVDRPSPPVGPVIFDEVFKDHMVVSWKPPLDDGGSEITNYIIEKKDTHKDLWMPVTSSTVKTTCKIPKLLEGREYQIRIYAENLYGISDPLISDEMKAKDRFRVPDAPEQPIIKDVTKDSAVVVWNKPYDGGKPITNYIVEKKETMATRWVKATKDPIFPGTKFKVPDLLEGCQYEFRVSAENEIGVGDPSPPSKPIFARDPIAKPSPPVNPEAVDKTKNSVDLSWQPPRHDGNGKIIGYLIEYQKVGDEEWKQANLTADSCPETNYKVTGLTEGLTYKFRVKAVNAAGESDPAHVPDPVEVKDRLEPPELILDANMAREQYVKAGDTLRLSAVIKGVPFPKVTWKKDDLEVSPKADIEVTGVGSKLEIRNTVHEDGGMYSLTVENPAGSKTVSVKVVVLDKPGPPRNLNISDVRSDSCYLTWMEPEDDGGSVITNYVVERKDVASAQWVAISSSSKKRSHMAKYLMEGTQYLFRVAAENQYGRGPYVETLKPIKAIDPLHPPGPPKNLHHVDVDKTEVSLVWNRPDRDGGAEITGYLVEYQEDGADEWTKFQTVPMLDCVVTGL
ncbi:TITIN protein, partial [Rhadina sibilatrix]|nr:TITIN protein [Rhadina sibilatrix]